MIDQLDALGLTDAHIKLLRETSAISPEVMLARGYRSASLNDSEYYKENGWANLARALPGLEIPLWGPNGRSTRIQLRPDAPATIGKGENARTMKYLFPAGETACVDVNPLIAERVRGNEPLFIVEGVRKADSGVSQGIVAIALMGVYNFRGQNGRGGVTALPDWEDVSLQGRDVYVVFDSDVMTNPKVQQALNRFVAFIANRGARVSAIILPEGPSKEKTGLDDFFARGHTVAELMACAKRDYFTDSDEQIFSTSAPVVYGSDTVLYRKTTKDGEAVAVRQNLASFIARVDQQITVDDGVAEPKVSFRVSGRTESGMPLRSTEIVNLTEIVTRLIDGSNPVWSRPGVNINYGVKKVEAEIANCLRSEMERNGVDEVEKYSHSGWRDIGGQMIYLTTSGGITGEGIDPSILVDLAQTQLEINISEIGTSEDVLQSLQIIDTGDARVLSPLLAATYAAPLRETLDVGFSIHLFGRTGSFKTEIARVLASHFGRRIAQRNGLGLGSWMSTGNAITAMASAAKDAVYVLDDLVPRAMNFHDLKAKTDAVFRSVGNASGRSRMTKDLAMRATYVPRCMVISTGEDLPPGESVIARLVLVEANDGWIAPTSLSTLQERAKKGIYERAMGMYINWLAANYEKLPAFIAEFEKEPEFATIGSGHARLPYNNRSLLLGAGTYLLFAKSCGAITLQEARLYMLKFRDGLAANALLAQSEIAAASIAARVAETINTRLSRGKSHLIAISGDSYRPGLEHFGWQLRGNDYSPVGDQLGFIDLEKMAILVKPGTLVQVMKEADIHVTSRQLVKELEESPLVMLDYAKPAPPSKSTFVVRVGSSQQRLMALSVTKVMNGLGILKDTEPNSNLLPTF